MRDFDNRIPLICKDCTTEIFVNVNMVMIKDELWKKICDDTKDAYCDCCLEKRLERKITPKDFKPTFDTDVDIIPCNAMWLYYKERKGLGLKCE